MRMFCIFIVALITFGFFSGVASAGSVSISGTHSESEIRATCKKEGGTFQSTAGVYSCSKQCGSTVCAVNCVGGKCAGSCPKCGQQERPFPVLKGDDVAERILKDSVEWPQ
jgi:hypothetical protein